MAADSTTSAQKRRATKPLMEKRRRARINSCLAQLKDIVMQSTDTTEGRASRLEKADILEMTVRYVRKVHKLGATIKASSGDNFYLEGYQRCVKEISEFFATTVPYSSEEDKLQRSLILHLQRSFSTSLDTDLPSVFFCLPEKKPSHQRIESNVEDARCPSVQQKIPSPCKAISVIVDPSSIKFREAGPKVQYLPSSLRNHPLDKRGVCPLQEKSVHVEHSMDMWRPW